MTGVRNPHLLTSAGRNIEVLATAPHRDDGEVLGRESVPRGLVGSRWEREAQVGQF